MAQVRYNEVKLFLVLIPLINAFNYYLTYPPFSGFGHLAITFLVDTLEGYLAWILLRSIILWLDKRMPLETYKMRRIGTQLLLTTVVAELAIISATWLLNLMFGNKPLPLSFFTHDILIFLVWFIVVNAFYIAAYYYQRSQQAEAQTKQERRNRFAETQLRTEGFRVKSGKQFLILDYSDIEGFFADGDYSAVAMRNGKKFLVDDSLEKLDSALPTSDFFRINRQYIVSRSQITAHSPLEYGKLNVELRSSKFLPEFLVVSRIRAAAFKEWFPQLKATLS